MKRVHRDRAGLHLETLLLDHDIEARVSRTRMTAEANIRSRTVFLPDLDEVCDYLIALHEIGHIVDQNARHWDTQARSARPQDRYDVRRDFKTPDMYAVAMMEMAAWAWACKEAKRSLLNATTAADWQVVADCLVSWLR